MTSTWVFFDVDLALSNFHITIFTRCFSFVWRSDTGNSLRIQNWMQRYAAYILFNMFGYSFVQHRTLIRTNQRLFRINGSIRILNSIFLLYLNSLKRWKLPVAVKNLWGQTERLVVPWLLDFTPDVKLASYAYTYYLSMDENCKYWTNKTLEQ